MKKLILSVVIVFTATLGAVAADNLKNANFKNDLYSRFERYAKIDTQSVDNSTNTPSSVGQIELAKIAAAELKSIGVSNVSFNEKTGHLVAEIPSNTSKEVPAIVFITHFDTALEASGKNVIPQIHKNYQGGDIVISKEKNVVLSPKDSPELLREKGNDIITASGDTLLGADCKAGMAIVMSAAQWLIKNPKFKHGPVKLSFNPDEEVGRSVENIDLKAINAKYGYAVDGGETGFLDYENFNGDGATITIKGKSTHPGTAKNVMINAVRVAAEIIRLWPQNMLPETTEGREGFIHFSEISGVEEQVVLKALVRNHDLDKLREQEKLLSDIANAVKILYPGVSIDVAFKESYRNAKEVLSKTPQVAEKLVAAVKAQGIEPTLLAVRGGTTGADLTFMGLPCVGIFAGVGNMHSRYEWVSLDGMEKAVKVVIETLRQWEQNPK
ncbi:MAG: peptidase T [Elusimicrobia bacterium]|nr:peptidase T [Elusimicrobiota bacterium]